MDAGMSCYSSITLSQNEDKELSVVLILDIMKLFLFKLL